MPRKPKPPPPDPTPFSVVGQFAEGKLRRLEAEAEARGAARERERCAALVAPDATDSVFVRNLLANLHRLILNPPDPKKPGRPSARGRVVRVQGVPD